VEPVPALPAKILSCAYVLPITLAILLIGCAPDRAPATAVAPSVAPTTVTPTASNTPTPVPTIPN